MIEITVHHPYAGTDGLYTTEVTGLDVKHAVLLHRSYPNRMLTSEFYRIVIKLLLAGF